MTAGKSNPPKDKTAEERRKGLTDEQIKELEQAGGVEGGMQAGSAGPRTSGKDAERPAPNQGGSGRNGRS